MKTEADEARDTAECLKADIARKDMQAEKGKQTLTVYHAPFIQKSLPHDSVQVYCRPLSSKCFLQIPLFFRTLSMYFSYDVLSLLLGLFSFTFR